MKTWVKAATACAALLWLAGCTSIPVETDYDPEYALSLTSTYAWMDESKSAQRDPLVENDLLARRVQRSVDAELAAQGLKHVGADQNPQLLVTFHAGSTEKFDIDSTDSFYGYYGYYPCWHCWGPGPYGGYGGRDVWVRYYTEGSLVVDIVDAKSKRLVWRGATERRLPKFKSPEERDVFVRESIGAIFQYFPPGRKPTR